MRYVRGLLGSFALIAMGCGGNQEFMTRFHEDGRAKPVVAITHMIDTSNFEAPWSLSDEFTSTIVQRLSQNGNLYTLSKEDDAFVENPFGQDLAWMKREFHDEEFAVFLELVQHETTPAKKQALPQEASTNLNMGVRLRVIDLRGATPQIVLQEMVRDTYFIPKSILPVDYSQVTWGTDEYRKTPMGIAHAQLVQEIATRIGDYILLAKSR